MLLLRRLSNIGTIERSLKPISQLRDLAVNHPSADWIKAQQIRLYPRLGTSLANTGEILYSAKEIIINNNNTS